MASLSTWHVTCFYRFVPLDKSRLDTLREAIKQEMVRTEILGLVLLAEEGINGTVAGPTEAIPGFKAFLADLVDSPSLRFKDSFSDIPPFHRVSVDIRKEIVGLKRPDLVPTSDDDRHLTPTEWHEFLASGRPHLLVDTRNRYETRVGKFAGALDPDLASFSNWAEYVDEKGLPKDVPVLIYCTGGIRCEKVILEMRSRGFEDVYQLRDGILGYLAEYPNGFYEGDCFVFDDRVAVNANLAPTERFGICPGCGLPGDVPETCQWCGDPFFSCGECSGEKRSACSKACLDRIQRHGPKLTISTNGPEK